MVMWHIKLKGMISRPGYNEKNYPRIKLVTLGWGQNVTITFLQERGDFFCVMTRHQMSSSNCLRNVKVIFSQLNTEIFIKLISLLTSVF